MEIVTMEGPFSWSPACPLALHLSGRIPVLSWEAQPVLCRPDPLLLPLEAGSLPCTRLPCRVGGQKGRGC